MKNRGLRAKTIHVDDAAMIPKRWQKHVYCTHCRNIVWGIDGKFIAYCKYAEKCYFWNLEDSTNRYLRPYYTPTFKFFILDNFEAIKNSIVFKYHRIRSAKNRF